MMLGLIVIDTIGSFLCFFNKASINDILNDKFNK